MQEGRGHNPITQERGYSDIFVVRPSSALKFKFFCYIAQLAPLRGFKFNIKYIHTNLLLILVDCTPTSAQDSLSPSLVISSSRGACSLRLPAMLTPSLSLSLFLDLINRSALAQLTPTLLKLESPPRQPPPLQHDTG